VANPTALILSSINMLRALNLPRFAELVNDALIAVYRKGDVLTEDLGGNATTTQFTKRIIEEIEKLDKRNH
jgi:isocitrate dehydrogenase (NAD+)